ncbi:PTS glucose transporter subunit IIA [Enterococcus hulanensis]|uniref:PTS glucose transporter subunit IIA n=1 Tax=Enterococcus hulanensis TaxID=2559929 RepID=A0ABU3F3U2_9ENTE|nr:MULTISPECIES: PTS glucose transporter subunit IIA [Enterococcus]MBX8938667.1 PTS glucose transporter subunit IIA [Enterococcus gilvus]MDT2601796.1 PTS glucose transporter subunit IIA [Enterococcus hulanensis]MDT2611181.1 PTS glucose transporter subunit IIA [Enterococcus hulanensis]MDT2618533.1 PTS glucose transporter subunit IIA [Enterococcus hulanensis]MDT2629678.1 PTS glucose transporter subunit IIA [Enterococcus hulanensis]
MLFFKTKKVLKSVANGHVLPLEAVKDEVFSSKMMGEGYAINQHDGNVYAPIEGVVESIFPTLHAITIESKTGEKLLIHMGLDTVELKGRPFSIKVVQGQKVKTGTLLASMDLSQLEKAEKDATIIVVFPEMTKGELMKENQNVTLQDELFKF